MWRVLLATTLLALAPVAYAQTNTGQMGGTSGGSGSMGQMSSPQARPLAGSRMAGQSQGENCGTPDEPKPCPPMPRRPLRQYPANKQ